MVSENERAVTGQGDAAASGRWWRSRRRAIPILMMLSLGVCLSVTAWFVTARYWEDPLAESELDMVAENRRMLVSNAFADQVRLVESLRGFFGSRGGVPSRGEFEVMTANFAAGVKSPPIVSWVAHVRDQDRATFESQARANQPDFEIRDQKPDGTTVAAPRRAEYDPVLFSTGGNGSMSGLDLATDGVLLGAVRQAGAQALTMVTPARPDGANGTAVISIVAPLFERAAASNAVSGFVLGTFKLGTVVESALNQVTAHGVDVYMYDKDSGADAAPLSVRSSLSRTLQALTVSRAVLGGRAHWTGKVTIANSHLIMVVVPVAGGALDQGHPSAWIILLVLLLCTAAIGAALAKSTRHAYALEVSVIGLRRRDAVLQAVAASGAELVGTLDFQQATATTLALVGRATGVDRVHLMRRTRPADAATRWDQQVWSAAQEATPDPVPETDEKQFGNDLLQPILGRQMEGGAIVVNAQQETGALRTALDRSKIRSMLAVPALLTQSTQCLLVFVCYATERHWSVAESAHLKIVADLLGGALARHLALAQLADANRIIENSSTMLFRATAAPGWPLAFVSENVARYGYSATELCATGRKFAEFIHPDDLPGVQANLARAIEAGQGATEIVCRERTADGNYRRFETKIVIHRDSVGQVMSISGIMLDVTDRKEAEDALVFSHLLLTTSLENSPDGILITDEHDSSIINNRRFSEQWNIPQDLLATGLDDRAIAAAATLVEAPEKFVASVRYINSHRDERGQDELKFKDGRFIERHTAPLADPAGRYLGRVWLFRDITARKQAQDALALSHVFLTAALEQSPDGIMITDEHGRGLISNPLFLKLWNLPDALGSIGFDEGAIKARSAQVKDPESYAARVRYIYTHPGEPTYDELEFMNGRFFERTTAPLSDSGGRYLGRIWILRDITERKLAQQTLDFSNTLMTAAMNSSPYGMLVIDPQSRIISFNDRFAELFNVSPNLFSGGQDEQVLGHVTSLVKNSAQFLQRVRHIFENPEERARDQFELKDGRTIDRHTAPLYDKQHRYIGFICFFRDVIELMSADQQRLPVPAGGDALADRLTKSQVASEVREALRERDRPATAED
jgi:PAS domain S-box-containing protein